MTPKYSTLSWPAHNGENVLWKTTNRFKALQKEAAVRYVLLLREPVSRAISDFNMEKTGKGWKMIDQYILQGIEDFKAGKKTFESTSIERGLYARILKVLKHQLGKDAVMVVNTHALDSYHTWEALWTHFGLKKVPAPNIIKGMKAELGENAGGNFGHYHPSNEVVRALKDIYREPDKELWRMLSVRPWW